MTALQHYDTEHSMHTHTYTGLWYMRWHGSSCAIAMGKGRGIDQRPIKSTNRAGTAEAESRAEGRGPDRTGDGVPPLRARACAV